MLSRLYLKVKALEDSLLPYDYHQPIQCELYKKMTLFNKEYSKFLHEEGYRSKDKKEKRMKLFNFGFNFYNLNMCSDGIIIKKGGEIKLCVSGFKEPLNAILQGFLINNKINVNGIEFQFTGIDKKDKVRFNKINIYKPLNPIIESKWDEKIIYLSPYQIEYYDALKQNLLRKYELIYNKEYTGELKMMIDNMLDVKPKTIKIKNNYLQGYGKFNILVQAEKDMQKVVYYCGLGQNNSLGAGYLEYIDGGE